MQRATQAAHPVAQGTLRGWIVVFPERISVTATVSMEEVLVATAYGGQKHTSALEIECMGMAIICSRTSGVAADGQPLDGLVVKRPEPANGPAKIYGLEYRMGERRTRTRAYRFAGGCAAGVRVRAGQSVGGELRRARAAARRSGDGRSVADLKKSRSSLT